MASTRPIMTYLVRVTVANQSHMTFVKIRKTNIVGETKATRVQATQEMVPLVTIIPSAL